MLATRYSLAAAALCTLLTLTPTVLVEAKGKKNKSACGSWLPSSFCTDGNKQDRDYNLGLSKISCNSTDAALSTPEKEKGERKDCGKYVLSCLDTLPNGTKHVSFVDVDTEDGAAEYRVKPHKASKLPAGTFVNCTVWTSASKGNNDYTLLFNDVQSWLVSEEPFFPDKAEDLTPMVEDNTSDGDFLTQLLLFILTGGGSGSGSGSGSGFGSGRLSPPVPPGGTTIDFGSDEPTSSMGTITFFVGTGSFYSPDPSSNNVVGGTGSSTVSSRFNDGESDVTVELTVEADEDDGGEVNVAAVAGGVCATVAAVGIAIASVLAVRRVRTRRFEQMLRLPLNADAGSSDAFASLEQNGAYSSEMAPLGDSTSCDMPALAVVNPDGPVAVAVRGDRLITAGPSNPAAASYAVPAQTKE